MKIVIVMPTYNEAMNIGRMIDVLAGKIFPEFDSIIIQLLVVDSKSPDGTAQIVKEKIHIYSAVHLLALEDKGLGYAYIAGFKYAMQEMRADAIIEMDADFQHDPESLQSMIAAFLDGADYVIGSRYTPGGSIPSGWARYRKVISCFGNKFARVALRLPYVNDLTTGFRLTKVKGVMEEIDLDTLMALGRFAYKVDLLYKTIYLSRKTIEIPIHFKEREYELSKFNFRELLATLFVVLRLRLKGASRCLK